MVGPHPLPVVLFFFLAFAGCATPASHEDPAVTPDPALDTVPPPPLFHDDVETERGWSAATYVAFYPVGRFIATVPHPLAPGWHRTDVEARSGSHSWTMQDESMGRYRDSQIALLTSPQIDLTAAKTAYLSFWMKGDSEEDSGEDFRWQVSDDGVGFETLNETDFPAEDWTLVVHDISAYAGGNLWIRFDMMADWCGRDTPTLQETICNPGEQIGYFLDDIAVTVEPPTA